MSAYDHKHIDQKWQKKWLESGVFNASDSTSKPKYYPLIEFPYPSGAGLHVGHPRPYIGLDIIARKRRAEGYNVLYPIGWDAFGLPTENYAIKTGRHPRDITKENTDTFRRQIQALGVSFDWSREINTTDPAYYKWTQWIFLQLYKKNLAYKAKTTINWCPKDKIGLANEEVVDGKCERCGTEVEKREKEQWMLAITKYAKRLYDDLDTVDYIERAKTQQRNWIGPSEGALISFRVIVEGQTKPNFLLIHGYGGSPKKDFFPWLKKKLEGEGYSVQVPELPNTNNPSEEEQVSYVLKHCTIDENTIIVGHSLGCVVARRALVKHGKPVRGLVQIASAVPPSVAEKPYQKNFTWEEDFETLGKLTRYSVVAADTREEWRMSYLKTLADSIKRPLRFDEAKVEHFCGDEEPALLRWIFPSITVFTTRPDTLFGATYMVLAPELRYVDHLPITNRDEVEAYRTEAKAKTEIERTAEGKEKTGVELKGIKAVNPATNEEIPVFIADYVLAGYGTGAIMAVPAHDERDNVFAKKFSLPIQSVIEPSFYANGNDIAAVHEGEPFVKREAACAIVRNPKDNTYLCVSWKGEKMNGLVTGGIDEGEDVVEAARREVHEETGYKNLRVLNVPTWTINTYFYHRLKKQNRHAHFHFVFFELENDERDPIDEKEAAIHDIVWKKKEELKNFFTVFEGDFLVQILENPEYIFCDDGVLIHSGKFDGLASGEARKQITEFVYGRMVTTYKLRDWVFSRQRYWGEPIPMIYCEKCKWVPVPENQLPVTLPEVEKYEPTDTGESPLATMTDWVNTKCPQCDATAKRETDVMPNWAGSSWYYLRYTDPTNTSVLAAPDALKYWTPVDWYNGGMEHTVLHLLYSRFWHKFLFDIGVVPTSEPYKKRTSHGIILAEGGEKMSKSKGNVVNPDDVIAQFGADALRVYEMFMGPFDQAIAWSTDGLVGTRRFLERVHTLAERVKDESPDRATLTLMHQTIKKVSEDVEELKMNTAVSALMIFTNELNKQEVVSKEVFRTLLLLLSPFAPHLSEELWEGLGEGALIAQATWPTLDPTLVKGTEATIAIQINGKTKGTISGPFGMTEKEALNKAMELGSVSLLLDKKPSMRLIYIPDRLLNIVV